MTPEAQRIAIAEVCGWIDIRQVQLPDGRGEGWIGRNGSHIFKDLPDYPNDLNAMHEAEEVLSMEQRRQNILNLRYVIFGSWPSRLDIEWQLKQAEIGGVDAGMYDHGFCAVLLAATAAQRAEALLRTLDKWDNTK